MEGKEQVRETGRGKEPEIHESEKSMMARRSAAYSKKVQERLIVTKMTGTFMP